VVLLKAQDNGSFDEVDFITGFEKEGDIIGRPVDIKIGPDDCAYVSDDYAGAIYRVCYQRLQSSNAHFFKESVSVEDSISPIVKLDEVGRGREIFVRENCAVCHTFDSDERSKLMLRDVAERYNDNTLEDFFETPTPPMPLLTLDKQESQALRSYILSL
jgi:mono/diheme cytochrome c family protein